MRRLLDEAAIPNLANSGECLQQKSGWDISGTLNGLRFTIEVKLDEMECQTGNVAVEYHNTDFDTPSGILGTSSNLWVIVLRKPTTAWACRSDELRRHLLHENCLRDIRNAGDGNASLKLYRRRELFEKLFHRIDELAPWELRDVLVNLLGEKYVDARSQNLAHAV